MYVGALQCVSLLSVLPGHIVLIRCRVMHCYGLHNILFWTPTLCHFQDGVLRHCICLQIVLGCSMTSDMYLYVRSMSISCFTKHHLESRG